MAKPFTIGRQGADAATRIDIVLANLAAQRIVVRGSLRILFDTLTGGHHAVQIDINIEVGQHAGWALRKLRPIPVHAASAITPTDADILAQQSWAPHSAEVTKALVANDLDTAYSCWGRAIEDYWHAKTSDITCF